jgi:hypothetical protein
MLRFPLLIAVSSLAPPATSAFSTSSSVKREMFLLNLCPTNNTTLLNEAVAFFLFVSKVYFASP